MMLALLAPLEAATAVPGELAGRATSAAPDPGDIGVRLLEVSANRIDDPRARVYIVDHINPGTRITRRFEVSNTSNTARRFTLYPGAAEIVDNNFVAAANQNANELPEWITIDRSEVTVAAHDTAVVTATITIPPSASRGERYGAIWAQVASSTTGAEGNLQQIRRVGIRVYLDVGPGGDPRSDFTIEELVPGRTKDGLPVVSAKVKNTGERALDLSGKLQLAEGPDGISAGPFPVQIGTTVVPGGAADVEVLLGSKLPDGPWQATLNMESGRIHRTATAELTFPDKHGTWGMPANLAEHVPWRAIGIVAALVVAVLMLVFVRSRLRPLHQRVT
ncbi:hypothetical protein [Micromonospora rifamycinica]|uniref:hypothetical protein n=1 Tax=Micromonospora rifamycinica TaxID=291594 RepID=UPI0012FCC23E|nr:hypothetical protein [Micromonospora rifamycinica]